MGTEEPIWLHDAAQLGKWRTSGSRTPIAENKDQT
jgi:hypothetical protein